MGKVRPYKLSLSLPLWSYCTIVALQPTVGASLCDNQLAHQPASSTRCTEDEWEGREGALIDDWTGKALAVLHATLCPTSDLWSPVGKASCSFHIIFLCCPLLLPVRFARLLGRSLVSTVRWCSAWLLLLLPPTRRIFCLLYVHVGGREISMRKKKKNTPTRVTESISGHWRTVCCGSWIFWVALDVLQEPIE